MVNFEELIDRRGTSCLKYDFSKERGLPEDVLPFWVADMDFRAPDPVVEELVRRSKHGIFGYTDIKEDYLSVLSHWLRSRHDWTPDMKTMTVTPGVVFAICTAIRALTREGDSVLICPPVYYPFYSSVLGNHRKLVESPLVLRKENDGRPIAYEIDFDDFENKIKDNEVKLFIMCSPHNPVGRVWKRDELERIGEICKRHGVVVIADEIHHDFVREGFKHTVFASISDEIDDITITCTSPSKTFNLAGLQISHVFIRNEALRHMFRQELYTEGYSQPNALGVFAAKAAYGKGEPWLKELLVYLEGNLQRTKEFLAHHLPLVNLVEPEGTYLLWMDFSKYGLSDKELDDIIIHRGKLWLDSGHIFGTGGKGFQRINAACPWNRLEEGLYRLLNCLDSQGT